MARRYIKMALPDGSATVNFYDYKLKLPDPFPELQYTTSDRTFQMCPTATGPGNLVHKSVGTDINHAEFEFVGHSLTEAEITGLRTMFLARPNVVLLSLDSGTTRYFAKFKNNGLNVLGYKNNENPNTGTAFFRMADIKLYILMSADQAFGG